MDFYGGVTCLPLFRSRLYNPFIYIKLTCFTKLTITNIYKLSMSSILNYGVLCVYYTVLNDKMSILLIKMYSVVRSDLFQINVLFTLCPLINFPFLWMIFIYKWNICMKLQLVSVHRPQIKTYYKKCPHMLRSDYRERRNRDLF